eukprot:225112_1
MSTFTSNAASLPAFICCLIGFPVFIFLTIFLYKHHHLIHYQKRGLKLVWGAHVQTIILYTYMNLFTIINFHVTYNTMWPICMLMLCSTIDIFGAGRYCYQFVNIRRQQDLSEWKLHLNPHYRSKLFVMRHIYIFGDNTKITFICFVVTICLMTIYIVGFLTLNAKSWKMFTISVGIITYFIAACLNLYFTQFGKYFKFIDLWGISEQQKIGAIVSMIIVLFVVIIIFVDPNYELALTLSNVVCSFLLLVFCTQNTMLPYKVYKEHQKYKQLEQQTKLNMDNTTCTKKKKKLFDTISDNVGYVLFMKHLYKEFSAENLLYLTLLLQFERFLIKHNFIDESMLLFKDNYVLPDCVPVSDTFKIGVSDKVNSSEIEEQIAISFQSIYEKFIKRSYAELEINIAYSLSDSLLFDYNNIKKDGRINKDDFKNVWAHLRQTAHEIYKLLTAAHRRFKYYTTEIEAQYDIQIQ